MSIKQSIRRRLPALIAALLLVYSSIRLAILFFKGAFGEIRFLPGGGLDVSYNFDPQQLGNHLLEMGVLLSLIVGIVFLIIYLVRQKRSLLLVSLAACGVACVVLAILPAAIKDSFFVYEYYSVRNIPKVGHLVNRFYSTKVPAIWKDIGDFLLQFLKFIPIIVSEGLMLISFFTRRKAK